MSLVKKQNIFLVAMMAPNPRSVFGVIYVGSMNRELEPPSYRALHERIQNYESHVGEVRDHIFESFRSFRDRQTF